MRGAVRDELTGPGECPQRLITERELLGPLPSLRPELGGKSDSRKVDKLFATHYGFQPDFCQAADPS